METGSKKKQKIDNDKFWWNFSLDWEERKWHELERPNGMSEQDWQRQEKLMQKNRNSLRDSSKTNLNSMDEVRTDNEEMRKVIHIDYPDYLGLNEVINSQVPYSKVPEERVFIITHQLCELLFKQMIFDLVIVSKTLRQFNDDINQLTKSEIIKTFTDFKRWLPAISSSQRLKYCAKEMLRTLGGFLLPGRFSGQEFAHFRNHLEPASGFQSFQFRLIQKAFSKAPAFDLKIFPSHKFFEYYGGNPHDDPVKNFTGVADEMVILKSSYNLLNPDDSCEESVILQLNDFINGILESCFEKFASNAIKDLIDEEINFKITPLISPSKVGELSTTLKVYLRGLDEFRDKQPEEKNFVIGKLLDTFKAELTTTITRENEERRKLTTARKGAIFLEKYLEETPVYEIFNNMALSEIFLHDKSNSFLTGHRDLADTQINIVKKVSGGEYPPKGTGGGGVPYLEFMIDLVQLFPSFVAMKNVLGKE